MSEFTSNVANDLADVINTVADKVKEVSEYAKLQALIKAEEAKKHDYYYRLGKKYYELYKDAPASDLTDITDKIVTADEKIAKYKEDLKTAAAAGYTDVTDAEDAEDESEVVETEEAESEDTKTDTEEEATAE